MKKKTKVAIVTIISNNYGNRLQNYALQEYLKTLDCKVETIPISCIRIEKIRFWMKKVLSVFWPKRWNIQFESFNRYIKWAPSKIEKNKKIYDIYIAGSDQIWNPNFAFNSDREFLTFAPSNKKFAYAASIGISQLPEIEETRFAERLTDFKMISVREENAADIVENLIGIRPLVVIDPTMLLTTKQWENILQNNHINISQPYIVKYFLGKYHRWIDIKIDDYAKKNGLKVIDINCPPKELMNSIGPIQFVHIIQNSELVCTDSFHGTVFSILYHKQFVVFSRKEEADSGNMNSRLDTLLKTFGLNDRWVHEEKELESLLDSTVSFDNADIILEQKRNEARLFLKNVISFH